MAKPWAQAFYKSKPWRNIRHEVLRRDGYTCCDCDGRANEVHHIIELTPENIHDPSVALNPDNLMAMCGDCHKKRTKGTADVADGYRFAEDGQVVREQHSPKG